MPPTNLRRVAIFGDSHGEALERHLKAALSVVYYSARRGRRLTSMLTEALSAPIREPDLVLFVGGGNDQQFARRKSDSEEQLSALLAAVKRRFASAIVAIVGPLAADVEPVRTNHAEARDSIRRVAARHGVLYIDPWAATENAAKSDGVHLRLPGYATLSDFITTSVHQLLSDLPIPSPSPSDELRLRTTATSGLVPVLLAGFVVGVGLLFLTERVARG